MLSMEILSKQAEFLYPILLYADNIFSTDIYLSEENPPFFSSLKDKGIAGANTFAKRIDHKRAIRDPLGKFSNLEELANYINRKKITRADINSLLSLLGIKELGKGNFSVNFSIEFTLKEKPFALFRFNASLARGKIVLTGRRLFHAVLTPQNLGLPRELVPAITKHSSGLIIIAGPTGSGKSTTLASFLNLFNEPRMFRPKVIVTIEKPIEYMFTPRYSLFIQREVGTDVDSFSSGIEDALRQNPDIIVVGEARTNEEIEQTLRAAETGHLTFVTLHTDNAINTIKRIAGVFSGNDEKRIRMMLASQIRAILVQRLVKGVDGKLLPAVEYMLFEGPKAQTFRQKIIEGKEGDLRHEIAIPSQYTMSLNRYLANLWVEGKITKEEAFANAYDIEEVLKFARG